MVTVPFSPPSSVGELHFFSPSSADPHDFLSPSSAGVPQEVGWLTGVFTIAISILNTICRLEYLFTCCFYFFLHNTAKVENNKSFFFISNHASLELN